MASPTFLFLPHHCRLPSCAGVGGSDRPNRKNATCIRQGCLGCCQAVARAAPASETAVICKAPNHKIVAPGDASQLPSASTSPSTPIRTQYAQPLSPTYAAKLANARADFPSLSGPGSASSNAQKNRFRVEDQHSIQVFYWLQVVFPLDVHSIDPDLLQNSRTMLHRSSSWYSVLTTLIFCQAKIRLWFPCSDWTPLKSTGRFRNHSICGVSRVHLNSSRSAEYYD